jgi:hypothetical protein
MSQGFAKSTYTSPAVAVSGTNGSFAFSTLTMGALNGLTFYTSNGSLVGSYTVPAASNPVFSGGTSSASLGSLVFSNSNGVSFGLNGSTMTASHNGLTNQTVQPVAVSGSNGSFAFSTLTLGNLNGASFYTSNGSVVASYTVPTQTTQPVAVSGSNGSFAFSTVTFGNLNGASFYTSNGSVVASYTVPTQSVQPVAYSGSNGSFSFNTITFGNLNGASFYSSNGSAVMSYTVPTVTNSSWTVSDSATSGTVGRLAFTNLNGVTLSLSTGAAGLHTIVGSHNALTSQSNQALSGSNGSFTFQTATFGNLNGMSFYTSNGSIVGSYTVPGGGVTPAVSGSNGSFSFSTVTFGNLNGVSFYSSNGSMVASYTVPTVTNSSWTVSDSATSGTVGRLAFTNLNGVTLSLSTGAAGLHTIVGSHNAITSQTNQTANFYVSSNSTQLSSSAGIDLRSISFVGAGIASVGVSEGKVLISVPAGGGGGDGYNIVSMLSSTSGGGTEGATFSTLSGSIGLMAGSNITLSQTSNTINIIGNTFSNSNGVSFGINNGTITASVAAAGGGVTFSRHAPFADREFLTGAVGQGSLYLEPETFPNLSFDRMVFPMFNSNSSNSSGSHTISVWGGIYTRNVSTLSLYTSGSISLALTHSGTAGSYSLYSGMRLVTLGMTTSLSEGEYYIGFVSRTTSGGANGTYNNYILSGLNSNFLGMFSSSHNTTYQYILGQGFYTATTAGMPTSIGFTQIQGSNSAQFRPPVVMFTNGSPQL